VSTYPLASTVTKALRRDAGIIVTPPTRSGYHVRGDRMIPASIFVDLVDEISRAAEAKNTRAAADLAEHLAALGWDVTADGERVLVRKVPTAAELRAKESK
jgi:hypothetical protein